MEEMCDGRLTRKELLRDLRKARKQPVEALARKVKEQQKIIERIKEQLRTKPSTVPDMASILGLPASDIMWYVAALKKYGEIAEGEKEGNYFCYELAEIALSEIDVGQKGRG